MHEKIKRYISLYVPVTTCTLRCHYCYITHHRLFEGPLPELPYSPERIRKALSKERLGGTCLVNFCGGGETLLLPKVVEYIKALLEEGHYVMVVTNATNTQRFQEIANFPRLFLSRLFFKFSYHYIELKERNLLETFFANIALMRSLGCSFTLEAVPCDELKPYIDEMITLAIEKVGAVPHCTIARDERIQGELPILTEMSYEEYKKTWSIFQSSLFEYKNSIFGIKRKEFCYAGSWYFLINIKTGIMTQCYTSYYKQNVLKKINKPIRFLPVGNNCGSLHCYNGHSYISLGVIPELQAPTYESLRNRVCADGTEWLNPEMKHAMGTKLYETNKELSSMEKFLVNSEIRFRRIMQLPRKIGKFIFKR